MQIFRQDMLVAESLTRILKTPMAMRTHPDICVPLPSKPLTHWSRKTKTVKQTKSPQKDTPCIFCFNGTPPLLWDFVTWFKKV